MKRTMSKLGLSFFVSVLEEAEAEVGLEGEVGAEGGKSKEGMSPRTVL